VNKYIVKHFIEKNLLINKPHGVVLLYHRVDDVKTDRNKLAVSLDHFEKQMEYLGKNHKVISLNEAIDLIQKNKIYSNFVCVTFDDGYADNLYKAEPILRKHKISSTVFVVTGMINKKTPYFWDVRTRKPDQGRCLTSDELIKLNKSRYISVGSHTISHSKLSKGDDATITSEICNSKRYLEKLFDSKVAGFSYPFGTYSDFDARAIRLVRNAGYNYACANYPGFLFNNTNVFRLPRFIVRNWKVDYFSRMIKSLF